MKKQYNVMDYYKDRGVLQKKNQWFLDFIVLIYDRMIYVVSYGQMLGKVWSIIGQYIGFKAVINLSSFGIFCLDISTHLDTILMSRAGVSYQVDQGYTGCATPQDEGWAQQIARHPIFDNVTILATQQRTVDVVHQP